VVVEQRSFVELQGLFSVAVMDIAFVKLPRIAVGTGPAE
jgi:hypothetical protein